jgi:hypothetical protein
LDLDGLVLVVDDSGDHWAKFIVHRVPPSTERPHGLGCSLTPHGPRGERLVGFDNAHPAPDSAGPGRRVSAARNHRHRLRSIRPYEYRDAATLLADFWSEVDAVLKDRGVTR